MEISKQKTVALSSTEAEYVAIAEAGKEAIHLQQFLGELGFNIKTTLFNDNQSAQMLAKNNVFHSKTKHINIKHHHIRDSLKEKMLCLEYVPTEKMIADLLTKGLRKIKHEACMQGLGLSKASSVQNA